MPNEQDQAEPRTLTDEIEAALAAVWARYVGARPTDAEIERDGNVVRLILPDGTAQFDRAMTANAEAPETDEPRRTVAGYEREAARAVSRTTRRRVGAMISKHDAKSGIATEVFILDPVRVKH